MECDHTRSQPGAAGGHRLGVNAVVVAMGGGALFTGGRDGVVRRWAIGSDPDDVGGSVSVQGASALLSDHADWVNSVAVSDAAGLVVSGSSDGTIKAWKAYHAPTEARPSHTFAQHTDYVKCVATVPGDASQFISGGLDSVVCLWDLECRTRPVTASGPPQVTYPQLQSCFHQHDTSVYCVDSTEGARQVVFGGTDNLVQVWDPRASASTKSVVLRGHRDVVRRVSVHPDGTMALTASSDRTIRLWDLGQQRCVQVFNIHQDSVFALDVSAGWSGFVSGDRAGRVCSTSLVSGRSTFEFCDSSPVLDLALSPNSRGGDVGTSVWCSTTSSDVKLWSLAGPASLDECTPGQTPESSPRRPVFDGQGNTAPKRGLASMETQSQHASSPRQLLLSPTNSMSFRRHHHINSAPRSIAPSFILQGRPAIIKHAILPDRRHVLSQCTDHHVDVWDVVECKHVRCVEGDEDWEDIVRKETEGMVISIPNWITVDTKTGDLAVHLAFPRCFSADIYPYNVGLQGPDEDTKINIGELVLRALFQGICENYDQRARLKSDASIGVHSDAGVASRAHRFSSSGARVPEEDADEGADPPVMEQLPITVTVPKSTRILLSNASEFQWATVGSFFQDLDELPPARGDLRAEVLGTWIGAALIKRDLGDHDLPKVGFFIAPADGGASVCSGKLNAPRVLRMKKVAMYVVDKMGARLRPDQTGLDVIELTCNGQPVTPNMDLITARTFLWKKPDELVIEYKVTDSSVLADSEAEEESAQTPNGEKVGSTDSTEQRTSSGAQTPPREPPS